MARFLDRKRLFLFTILLAILIFTNISLIRKPNNLESSNQSENQRISSDEKIETNVIEVTYHTDLNSIVKEELYGLTCQSDVSKDFKPEEKLLSDLFRYINDYEFTDEYKVVLSDGSTKIENEGMKSQKNINYNSVCKSELGYLLLFETESKDFVPAFLDSILLDSVYAAGGGSPPSNFGFIDTKGEITLIEDITSNLKRINVDWGNDAPYFGCRKIIGTTNEKAIIACGGGDGPGYVTSIFLVELKTKNIIEQVRCGNIDSELQAVEEVRCYDKGGRLYYEGANTYN